MCIGEGIKDGRVKYTKQKTPFNCGRKTKDTYVVAQNVIEIYFHLNITNLNLIKPSKNVGVELLERVTKPPYLIVSF